MAEQRVQRRLAAILAADVVGYSRLMEADEEGTRARMRSLHAELIDPRVAADGGRIFKTTGDGVLIEFPSAIDAVRNALAIQAAMGQRNADVPEERRIEFRVGVNVGDVIVEGDDIHGEGVNVAARLEGLCEPGMVYLSKTVQDYATGKVEASFEDLGEHTVKNITQPLRVFRAVPKSASVNVAIEAAAAFDRPAIAVLPFDNIGSDPDQEHFADGLTEDIITALSLCRSFPVIARNSTFTYKGRAVKVQEVGRELGARYVLEGSLRRAADRLRVTAQLIDCETGHHVWADRFDRKLEDVFAVQDEITERIAGVVAPELSKAEFRRSAAKRPDNLNAWECTVRGIAAVYEGTKEGSARAHTLLKRAIELDPSYSKAHTGLAYLYQRDLRLEMTDDPDLSARLAVEAARKAVALDNSDSDAQTKLARALSQQGEKAAALSAARHAVELNPFDAEARMIFGSMLANYATPPEPEEGLKWMMESLTLNPRDPRLYIWRTHMAGAHFILGHYEQAVDLAREALVERPDYVEARLVLAAALGFLDRQEELRAVLDPIEPSEITSMVQRRRIWGDSLKAKVLDGLRKAGLQD